MQRLAIALVAFATAFATAAAFAQYPGGGTGRGGPGATGSRLPQGGTDRRDARPADVPVSVAGQVQVQLDRLGDDLRINAAQQPAWDVFATRAMRLADDVARARFAMRAALEAPPSTAQEQFDRIADAAHQRAAAIDGVADAGRALYATLAPEQKLLADRRLALVLLPLAAGAPQVVAGRTEEPLPR